jgi:FkbM family methyltransferase
VLKLVSDGIWLPETEQHMLSMAADYQVHKLIEAMQYVRGNAVAVDVGAHCGLWSRRLVNLFTKVYAFEPIPLHREAYQKNVVGNYELFPYACGEKEETVRMKTVPHSTGDTLIDEKGDVEARVVRLDDHIHVPCDFLKIDTEGYELFVLRGGKRLLKSKPCVIVEQKPKKAQKYGLRETGAVKFLRKLGAVQRAEIAGDYIMSWDE